MVTAEDVAARKGALPEGDLPALIDQLRRNAAPVLERMPPVPRVKALLSSDGGVCPSCREQLEFDPWSPSRHRCPGCGTSHEGSRHDAHWARAQHLWLAERAAHLATLATLTDDRAAAARSREILAAYFDLYFELPNSDNVLGPTHLFFSTYLESIWILNYLAAADQLRALDVLSEADLEAVGAIADEAANLIGEFNEGFSNRQTWNSAALVAIAAWFGDDELAQTAIGGPTGLLGHLTDGFGEDGMWREGENYHLFAIRGLLLGLEWARAAGVDLLGDERIAGLLGRALMAPAFTALPDLTFPARKDSRFGVSLAHPAYLECWEAGLARLGDDAPEGLVAWLEALYRRPASAAQTYDAYLHDAGGAARTVTARADLSWWMAFAMVPSLPESPTPFEPGSVLLPEQGVAILRGPERYLSVECGALGGGHGHPDRLHLTLHAGGIHWLADPGTGLYVNPDLFWYRSTLAHNAPRSTARPSRRETPVAWRSTASRIGAGSPRGTATSIGSSLPARAGSSTSCPSPTKRVIASNCPGTSMARSRSTPGHLDSGELAGEQISDVQQFQPAAAGDLAVTARRDGGTLRLHIAGGTLLRATAPGRPGQPPRSFLLVRADGEKSRLVSVIDLAGQVEEVSASADQFVVREAGDRNTTIRLSANAVQLESPDGRTSLAGGQPAPTERRGLMANRPITAEGQAFRIEAPPALDGSLDGFDCGAPLEMGDEGHYYRSEEPYQDPEQFSATAYVNFDHEHLYLAVDVVKPEIVVRAADAPALRLDNDPDEVHSDGIQVYYRAGDATEASGFLILPRGDGLFARSVESGAEVSLAGRAGRTDSGYTLTVALPCSDLDALGRSAAIEFDVCVNEMRPGRVRRAGQLAWGGAGGWVYLRGDRRDERLWGRLELLG
ncbi:MAG: heparinase II/III family protein [Gemmatimonadales bacterium]